MSLLWFWGFFGGMAAGYCLGRALRCKVGIAFALRENGFDANGVMITLQGKDAAGHPIEMYHFLDVGEWQALVAKVDAQAPWK